MNVAPPTRSAAGPAPRARSRPGEHPARSVRPSPDLVRGTKPASHTASPPATSRGFGLLEAMVALAIFSLVGLTLFSWVNASLGAAVRLRERDREQHARHLAAAWVETLNPLATPRGQTELAPGWPLQWESRPLGPLTAVAPVPGGVSTPFRVRLFEITATLQAPGALPPVKLQMRRLGHERDGVADASPVGPPR